MKTVCILGGFNLTDRLHELHIIVSRIKNYKFLFPDLDHVKELTLYYEFILFYTYKNQKGILKIIFFCYI